MPAMMFLNYFHRSFTINSSLNYLLSRSILRTCNYCVSGHSLNSRNKVLCKEIQRTNNKFSLLQNELASSYTNFTYVRNFRTSFYLHNVTKNEEDSKARDLHENTKTEIKVTRPSKKPRDLPEKSKDLNKYSQKVDSEASEKSKDLQDDSQKVVREVSEKSKDLHDSQKVVSEANDLPDDLKIETQEIKEEKLTLFKRYKKMMKEYWYILIPVHMVTSTLWFGSFYVIAKSGFDFMGLLEMLNLPEILLAPLRNTSLGYIAVASALYKLATPARYMVTLGGTTVAIKFLTKRGLIKPVPTKDKLKTMLQTKLKQNKKDSPDGD